MRQPPALKLETVHAPEAMATLADGWNDLAERCTGYFLSQTHQWATVAWDSIARPRGRSLAIVVGRAEGRMVALWPLVTNRAGGVRVVRPLGSEATEYCAPLVEPAAQREQWLSELWRTAAAIGDVAQLPHLDLASDLAQIVRRESRACFVRRPDRAPYVRRRDHESWPDYFATVSASHRSGLRRKRRRLERLGEITFARESPAVAATMIGWLLDHKRGWMDRREIGNEWLHLGEYRDFLQRLVSREGPMGSLSLFVLRAGSTPVAAQLNSIDRSRVEFLIGAHDAAFAACSPGEITTGECLRWAFEHDLDYDFRIGDEAYKLAWAKRWRDTATVHVGTSLAGMPSIAALHARDQVERLRFRLGLGRFLPASLRARFR